MSTVPANAKLRLEWYEAHIAQIAANAVAIGTTTTATTDLSTKITAARAKYLAKLEAEAAAKTATSEWHSANTAMGTAGSAIIDQIRAKAKTVGGNSIYELAGIPAPATPTPVGAPGTPYKIDVTLQPDGSLKFTWKCDNPSGAGGTIYNVYRAPSGSEDFQYLGGSGRKEFIDFSLTSGVTSVTYKIQAIRSTTVGVANEFTVKFGVGSSGAMTAMIIEGGAGGNNPKPAKIAA